MTHTIHLTAHQAHSLRHVITQCIAMAERSPTVAALIGIEAEDLVRVNSILASLPKLKKQDGRNVPNIQIRVQPAYPAHRADHPATVHADPSAAHGNT